MQTKCCIRVAHMFLQASSSCHILMVAGERRSELWPGPLRASVSLLIPLAVVPQRNSIVEDCRGGGGGGGGVRRDVGMCRRCQSCQWCEAARVSALLSSGMT